MVYTLCISVYKQSHEFIVNIMEILSLIKEWSLYKEW